MCVLATHWYSILAAAGWVAWNDKFLLLRLKCLQGQHTAGDDAADDEAVDLWLDSMSAMPLHSIC